MCSMEAIADSIFHIEKSTGELYFKLCLLRVSRDYSICCIQSLATPNLGKCPDLAYLLSLLISLMLNHFVEPLRGTILLFFI